MQSILLGLKMDVTNMATHRKYFLLLSVMILLTACTRELTRDQAASLLKQKYQPPDVPRKSRLYNCGIGAHQDVLALEAMREAGIVQPKPCQKKSTYPNYDLTLKGREAGFELSEFRMVGDPGDGSYAPSISVGAPCYKPEIGQVTGITSISPTEARVDFGLTWNPTLASQDYPGIFESYLFGSCDKGSTAASALFRLYDDGWRIVEE